jgi:signal transduction histidine kinase
MNIRTKNWLATGAALAAIGLIAAAIAWSAVEVVDATRQRRQTTEILQRYTELQLVGFDYLQNRSERARVQSVAVSNRIDALLAAYQLLEPAHAEIQNRLHARRATASRLFDELAGAREADFPNAISHQRFEAQLVSRLRIDQQDSLADAFALTALANQRIEAAQGRVLTIIAAGLGSLALSIAVLSWLIRRHVLTPVVALQRMTQLVAAGNLDLHLGLGGDDEIAALSRDFDAMTQALRASFARLELSNRDLTAMNKELEAFGYSVSHDLRAPLRSIDGFSLALLEDYHDKLDDAGRDALARIRAASQRMDRLLDDLQRLSRVTRAELEIASVDLSAMACEVGAGIDRDEGGHLVQWRIDPNLRVMADPALMRIAMQNLMHNAWKFTHGVAQPVVRVGASPRDGKTVVAIADNGAGFDMAYAGRLFGAFQRLHTTEQFPGTGIGLAIVQRIIHRHGGEIWAEAKPGEGAIFSFQLEGGGP